jgi:ubiquinone/menaquinone biosynthesis C-methylase UbiE
MPSSRPVRIAKARTLLQPGIPPGFGGVWADLGCGDGIFTAALASLAGPEGEIYAVDKSRGALERLKRTFTAEHAGATVHAMAADFTDPADSTGTRRLPLPPLDGIVMANSLHFVRNKTPVLTRVAALLKPGGRLIVVEYNASQGNFAVPHPLDELGFLRLAGAAGLRQAHIMSRIPSSFLGEMYAGIAFAPGGLDSRPN